MPGGLVLRQVGVSYQPNGGIQVISHHISAAVASERRDCFLAEKQAADRARQARPRRRRAGPRRWPSFRWPSFGWRPGPRQAGTAEPAADITGAEQRERVRVGS
jgi:hypothetical protein